MKLRIIVACFFAVASPLSTWCQRAMDDPYAPLRLYEGKWDLEMSGARKGDVMHIENRCAKTGLFYVCEQVINGKSEDLVIFLPTGATGSTQNYRTQALLVSAKKPSDWNKLEISGDHWTYSSEDVEDGAEVYWRTTNLFSGSDNIHFEVQRSADGKPWKTKSSGDEHRVVSQ